MIVKFYLQEAIYTSLQKVIMKLSRREKYLANLESEKHLEN